MGKQKIGVIVDSFRCDNIRDGILKAKEVGARGIQIYAVKGPMHPDNLNPRERRDLLNFIKDKGLTVSALCGDLGGGFANENENRGKIELSKKIMDLAVELEAPVVTTHIGVVPEDPSHPRYAIMARACEELARYGDSVGASFAVETGPERAVVLKAFLDSLTSRGVRVNLDPANFVMVTGDDPAAAVGILGEYIVHTHAKDGIRLRENDPEVVYGMHNDDSEESQQEAGYLEKPLGEGDVDFDAYMKALIDIGYEGFLTIEREVGDDPEKDIRQAVGFLNKYVKEGK
jgi:L-ribulose-5-phosphate 3-epimerase